jgi:hypothetical protein
MDFRKETMPTYLSPSLQLGIPKAVFRDHLGSQGPAHMVKMPEISMHFSAQKEYALIYDAAILNYSFLFSKEFHIILSWMIVFI